MATRKTAPKKNEEPVEDTPAEDTPTEDTPTEDTPARNTPQPPTPFARRVKDFDPVEHLVHMGRDKKTGKDRFYLPVDPRKVWFNLWCEENEAVGLIKTVITQVPIGEDPCALARCEIYISGDLVATAHGSADRRQASSYWKYREVEKAETAAIGRALDNAGFGTGYALGADDAGFDSTNNGELADSPQPSNGRGRAAAAPSRKSAKPAPVFRLARPLVNAGEADSVVEAKKKIEQLLKAGYTSPTQNSIDDLVAELQLARSDQRAMEEGADPGEDYGDDYYDYE